MTSERRCPRQPIETATPLPVRRTGIVTDPRCGGHAMGPDEPECPARLDVLHALIREPGLREHLQPIAGRPALTEELGRVHDAAYLRRIADTAGRPVVDLDPDTRTSPLSHEAALLAAGGVCRAIEAVWEKSLDNAFALIRPPGHHAERAAAKGYCLYNNVAVGARFAQRIPGCTRILIVDWDLHHGNGTQHCFEEDPTVLFISIHRAFEYPHSGRIREIGRGPAKGFTVNIPLLAGCGDAEYLALFKTLVTPIALQFTPDLILVSAGFDIHADDPMKGMRVTPEGFAGMTRELMDIADVCCGGRLVMALEGGYGLDGLRDSVRAVLLEMLDLRRTRTGPIAAAADPRRTADVVWRVARRHRRYWNSLAAIPAPPLAVRISGRLARLGAYFSS